MAENVELKQHLTRKEAELSRAEETIRREQQLVQTMAKELAQAQQQLKQQVNCTATCVCYSCQCIHVWAHTCVIGRDYQERAAAD